MIVADFYVVCGLVSGANYTTNVFLLAPSTRLKHKPTLWYWYNHAADAQHRRIDERDSRAFTTAFQEVEKQGAQYSWPEFEKAVIAHKTRKFGAQVAGWERHRGESGRSGASRLGVSDIW